MEVLKNTFLFRLFGKDKLLFGVIAIYIVGVLYYASRQREEFPFLLYGMYSLKEKPQETYSTYSIRVDDQEIKYAKLRNSQRELIACTMSHAIPLIEAGKLSVDDETRFKTWLMNYCLDMRLIGDSKMDVYRLTCGYDSVGQIKVLKKDLIYSYAAK
jgi:hypothetical protein